MSEVYKYVRCSNTGTDVEYEVHALVPFDKIDSFEIGFVPGDISAWRIYVHVGGTNYALNSVNYSSYTAALDAAVLFVQGALEYVVVSTAPTS